MNSLRTVAGLAATGMLATSVHAGQIETYLSFQARLTDLNGDPLSNGDHFLDFFIYDAPSGGSLIGEILTVQVTLSGGNGIVSVPIGPAQDNWFADAPRYLGLTVDDNDDDPAGDELLPRIHLTAVPFAMRAFSMPTTTNLVVQTVSLASDLTVGGNVGIGTASAYRLAIAAPGLAPSQFIGDDPGGMAVLSDGSNLASYDFSATAHTNRPLARIAAAIDFNGSGTSKLLFGTSNDFTNGVTNTAMAISADGRVGIGNANPTNGSLVITAPVADSSWGITWGQGSGSTARAYLNPDGLGDFDWHLVRGGGSSGIVMSPSGRVFIADYAYPGAPVFDAGVLSLQAGTMGPENGFALRAPIGSTARMFHMPDGSGNTNFHMVRGGDVNAGLVVTADGDVRIENKLGLGGAGEFPAPAVLNIIEDSNTSTAIRVLSRFQASNDGDASVAFEFQDAGIGDSNVLINEKVGGGSFNLVKAQYLNEIVFKVHSGGLTSVKTLQILGGGDVAEPFSINTTPAQELQPGMVVVIDARRPGELTLSSEPYDPKVAGVISGANGLSPGLVLQAEGLSRADREHNVALTGRVWCWCDASFGSIEPGDRLTTSATAGHAMRAAESDRADGAVIGKAMTSLVCGRGLVLVLVQPQ